MASKVEICGVNTSKLPRYRDREMQEMLEAIKAGDERMRDEFIRGNLRLVLRYKNFRLVERILMICFRWAV